MIYDACFHHLPSESQENLKAVLKKKELVRGREGGIHEKGGGKPKTNSCDFFPSCLPSSVLQLIFGSALIALAV